MASPQIFEDLSSVFSILLQKKSEHTFLYYPLFQDYLNLLTLVDIRSPCLCRKQNGMCDPLRFLTKNRSKKTLAYLLILHQFFKTKIIHWGHYKVIIVLQILFSFRSSIDFTKEKSYLYHNTGSPFRKATFVWRSITGNKKLV